MSRLLRSEWTVFVVALLASILTAILMFAGVNAAFVFIVSAVALASLASVVGHSTEQLGNYLGPGPTGILQASVASLPELFVSFFALQAGLIGFPFRWIEKWYPAIRL
jgi:Ca2+:H+ antiporter